MLGRHSRGEIAVDFDDGQAPDALKQRPGQRAQARPDLDYVVVRSKVERRHDALDGVAVDQEMLAEASPREVTAGATPPSRG
jgi:hypothetical protein